MTTEKQLEALGYWIDRGNYVGTTDDRADRWYINTKGQPIDHRGAGWATHREAIEELSRRLEPVEAQSLPSGSVD